MKTVMARAAALCLLLLSLATPALCQIPAGQRAPDFQLPDLDGHSVGLHDYAGKPMVLVIGTTWCPGCVAQLSELVKIRQFLDQKQIPVLEVFLQEKPAAVRRYLKKKKLPAAFRPLIDDGRVHRAYRVYPIPRLLILDTDRKVVEDSLGLGGADIIRLLETLLPPQLDPESAM